jgi:EAL domain-containing protein (putative c-di-GMP-specific phosphodiesterase class I)
VNVSARSLSNPQFPDFVSACLERHGVSSEHLIIEVTETALITQPACAIEILTSLAERGIRVSLDDFGCGQTSLNSLASLPLHELKIDRSFVSDMLVNSAHGAIVRSIVDLGHDLAFRVVAEGVETEAVLRALEDSGCDDAQGYFLALPMPADQLARWFEDLRAHSLSG